MLAAPPGDARAKPWFAGVTRAAVARPEARDTHRDNVGLLKNYLFPPFDRALSALWEDLHERGLLAQTLVVVAGEFGRSPRIVRHERGKSLPGRDHWAKVQTILLAGGGVQGGRVIGSSDKVGSAPASDPQTPVNSCPPSVRSGSGSASGRATKGGEGIDHCLHPVWCGSLASAGLHPA